MRNSTFFITLRITSKLFLFSSLLLLPFLSMAQVDTDGDGVFNSTDLDDDNDGILDTIESLVNNFVFVTPVLTENVDINGNRDGSGNFLIAVEDTAGNSLGSITLSYFGMTGDGGLVGGQGGPGTNPTDFYTPMLNLETDGNNINFYLIYAVPDVNNHVFEYSITTNKLDLPNVRHNIQANGAPG